MLVFIPPAMSAAPAIFARFVQFVPSLIGLFAFAPMTLDRFMKMMIRPADAALAIVVIGAQTRRTAEEQESRQRRAGQHYFPGSNNSQVMFRLHRVLSSILRWGLEQG